MPKRGTSNEYTYYGYSLEVPQRGTSDGYPYVFVTEIRKYQYFLVEKSTSSVEIVKPYLNVILVHFQADRMRRMKGITTEEFESQKKHRSADDLDDGYFMFVCSLTSFLSII